ncbi:NAD(P)-binding protein [Atractiella rhizophila]|nr:NAD(P)-binding protein [Atractiella rhizophila]
MFVRLIIEKHTPVPLASRNLTGRTAIITGANTGIGFETTLALLRMKPKRLILAVRDEQKGTEAVLKLKDLVKDTSTNMEVWKLDLESFDSVKAFVTRANTHLDRLDILVGNAGKVGDKVVTGDGWESILQVNVISNAAVALCLLSRLHATAALPVPVGGEEFRPHLAIVSSDTHELPKFEQRNKPNILRAINEETFVAHQRYWTSKLLDVLFTRELAKLPQANGIIVSSPNPGCHASSTNCALLIIGEALAARSTEMGARNVVWGSVEDFETGSYINMCKVQRPSTFVTSVDGAKAQKKVFEELVTILRSEGFQFGDICNGLNN